MPEPRRFCQDLLPDPSKLCHEATRNFTSETITSLMTRSGVYYVLEFGRVNGVVPLSAEDPETRGQMRVHEKLRQFAKFQTVKSLLHFPFDIHLTYFRRNRQHTEAHDGA